LAEKPLETLDKFREGEALIAWKAMGPPVFRESVDVGFYFSQGFQKVLVVEGTGIT
jgi:hypothetical protein